VKPGTAVDLYNLTLVNDNTVVQRGLQRGNFAINTTGARFAGDHNNVLWDFEGAIQLGRQAGQDVVAGMGTAGLGYNFKCAPWNPTVWVFYDYASGGRSGNTRNTFHQLFPFGHYYLGWADLIGRQNIQDLNAHLYFYPAKWLTCWAQYHRFWLADRTDALYNTAGNVSRLSATGAAGNSVGHEVDFVMNFHLTRSSDILVGYNYFFAGDFIRRTAAPGQTGGFDSSTLFLQYNFRW
jgi:Alginate export